jgi:hypothetical protein
MTFFDVQDTAIKKTPIPMDGVYAGKLPGAIPAKGGFFLFLS